MSGLREALEASFRGESAPIEGEATEVDTSIDAGQPADPTTDPAPASDRDERGRFKAREAADKSTATDQTPPEGADAGKGASPTTAKAPQQEGQPAKGSPIAPPEGWSDTAKVQWNRLPRAVQEELGKMRQGAGDFEPILAPHRERYASFGMNDQQAIQALLAADEMLNRDPAGTIKRLAENYGVNLAQLAGTGAAPGSQDEPEYVDPQLKALQDEIATLKGYFQTQSDASEAQNRTRISNQVSAFRDSHEHYDIVAPHMAKLISSGAAEGLDDAYEMACWANPAVRAEMVRAEQEAQAKRKADEAAERTRAARLASGSVTGSPGGRGAPHGDPSAIPLRDVISAQFEQSRV
ncbi:hypothetical protein [Geminicoccus harenae]|uniref:hypothetical protein n=1 Tax=Geminicoccus harenae TaxID=2498453 RepID=UPI00168A5C1A|nr:hypothetical protein [Geminicoccus harenae]